ncbi:hypothetical protein BOTBODRAFT_33258 [Botryobasidium botryosum FD-172 SS1]|uniref:Uncharacterized protein n=1 Tax=Botryobasidium botryosum (strain FD-172 SS1) TaxID=930990 RepID=A0A067MPQ8_BOTB1|nr:hypothetical protein BOTBODRAFT_33258 [Botryobasidium botryosum FD-172 SS1]
MSPAATNGGGKRGGKPNRMNSMKKALKSVNPFHKKQQEAEEPPDEGSAPSGPEFDKIFNNFHNIIVSDLVPGLPPREIPAEIMVIIIAWTLSDASHALLTDQDPPDGWNPMEALSLVSKDFREWTKQVWYTAMGQTKLADGSWTRFPRMQIRSVRMLAHETNELSPDFRFSEPASMDADEFMQDARVTVPLLQAYIMYYVCYYNDWIRPAPGPTDPVVNLELPYWDVIQMLTKVEPKTMVYPLVNLVHRRIVRIREARDIVEWRRKLSRGLLHEPPKHDITEVNLILQYVETYEARRGMSVEQLQRSGMGRVAKTALMRQAIPYDEHYEFRRRLEKLYCDWMETLHADSGRPRVSNSTW